MHIVLTGSSTGIGRALAERLIARGDTVYGVARSAQTPISGAGHFHALRCDIADWEQVQAAAAEVATLTSSLDGVIACAGVQGEVGPTVTCDAKAWSATVRANLDGTFYTLRAFHPLLARAPRRAKVVCFSGGGATKPRPNFSAYGVAKTGVVRLVETIAEEMRGQPYDINAIAPGAINTRLTDEVLAKGPAIVGEIEYAAALKQKQTGGASLDKALGLVEFLLSPASDGIAGRLLSAPWDPWETLGGRTAELAQTDIYTLRRIVPEERGRQF